MSKFRFASATSFIVLASMIAGCAAPKGDVVSVSGFGGKANGDVGIATKALIALNSNDVPTAIAYAERAVEKTPDDAGFRALLGNAYFAGGRFASAESAYKDSLTIYAAQPQVVLKLALAHIAQGENADAVRLLESGRGMLDPADFGLALALAGNPAEAIPVLETSARVPNADPRVRQNLALAYALAGDWTQAKIVAAQDVPADQLDGRIQQWMQLAKPAKVSDQVAALTGITPAAVDPGQPTRLAYRQPETRQAEAAPAPVPAPQPQVAEYAPSPPPPVQVAEAAPVPQFAEAPLAPVEAAPPLPPPAPEPAPAVAEAPDPAPAPEFVAASAPEAVYSPPVRKPAAPKASRGSISVKLPPVRKAALRRGNSKVVMQLGAYRSPQHVTAGWNRLTQRYPALRAYLPLRARFDSPKGTFWRLSVQGFATQREAIARCQLLKSRGGACFVRNVAGDSPVQIASR